MEIIKKEKREFLLKIGILLLKLIMGSSSLVYLIYSLKVHDLDLSYYNNSLLIDIVGVLGTAALLVLEWRTQKEIESITKDYETHITPTEKKKIRIVPIIASAVITQSEYYLLLGLFIILIPQIPNEFIKIILNPYFIVINTVLIVFTFAQRHFLYSWMTK